MSQSLNHLTTVYVFKPVKTKSVGEYSTKWNIQEQVEYLNVQQDFNELDRNSSGNIDYETIKLRTDRVLNIKKGDGISFSKTEIPQYTVQACPKIGRSTVYTCNTYMGE